MLRIIYAGTPEFAVPALEALESSEHEILAVYTQPDRPAGRGQVLQSSPVKQYANAQKIPVEQPQSFEQIADLHKLSSFNADLMVVAAYGIILPQDVLNIPRHGCLNIHASLLPRWRGAAPIQRAIQAGDAVTGITIMQMDKGLDTGDILAKTEIALDDQINAAVLHDKLSQLGADLLLEVISQLQQGSLNPQPQRAELSSYATKLNKQEAEINWFRSAVEIQQEVRAFNPWPVSYTELDGRLVKIWQAEVVTDKSTTDPGRILRHDKSGIYVACESDVLKINELQFSGKKKHNAGQVLNARNLTGCIFKV